MKKNIKIALFIAVLAGVYHTGCDENKNESSPITTMRTTAFDDAQGNCTNGGIKVEVLVDGSVDDAQTQYLCNGDNGINGQNGQDGQDGQDGQNGQDGQDGKVATIQTMSFAGEQNGCKNGGIQIDVLLDGVVQQDQTKIICNGADGKNGENGDNGDNGTDGISTLVNTVPFTGKQENCENGGIRIEVGADTNRNATLDEKEVISTRYVCNGQNGQDGTNVSVDSESFEDAQNGCTNGGIKLTILHEGQEDQVVYVCNGVDGKNGANGTNTSMQTTPFSGAAGDCTNGGVKIDILKDGEIQPDLTQYVCNGVNGQDGQNGQDGKVATIQTMSFAGEQNGCKNGGIQIDVLIDGIVQPEQTKYICNGTDGKNGENGENGQDGVSTLVNTVPFTGKQENCENGGIRIEVGTDTNRNATLDEKEVISTRYVCNGVNGQDGKNGQDGATPTIVTSPFSGAQGICEHGGIEIEITLNEATSKQYICHGADGQDGKNGQNGQNGQNALVATSDADAAHCANGGILVDTGLDTDNSGTLETNEINSSSYVCNGQNGQNGADGTNGTNASVDSESFDGEQNGCTNGGIKLTIHNEGQADQVQVVCNGADGQNGENGIAECLTDNGCRETAYCDLTTHICVDKKAFGESCTQSYECISGTCYYNVCFNDVGDKIIFGHYEQDNNTSNGKEPISWIVLDRRINGQLLVISEKVLDKKQYNTTDISITWEKSTIRSWLNGYDASYNTVGIDFTGNNFIDTAFTAEEKSKIVSSSVPAHANPSYSTSPGNATTDKIFLLSITEANNYFATDAKRQADATRYAVKQGVYVKGSESGTTSSDGTCTDVRCYAYWWLRSPGRTTYYAAYVGTDGSVYHYGLSVSLDSSGIRPAMWVQY